MKSLKLCENLPWMVFIDFNEVLKVSEKWGGRTRLESQMRAFRDCLLAYDLEDLGFSGPPFTWYNNHEGDQRILERIDRALANSQWWSQFPNVNLTHRYATYSNHCPYGLIPVAQYT